MSLVGDKMRITLSTEHLYTPQDVDYVLGSYESVSQAYNQALQTPTESNINQLVTVTDLAIRAKDIGFMNSSICDFKHGRDLCDKVQSLLDGREGR